ncbi:DUF4129 domain-containing protein [Algicella marina]|uniref:DUF4129 domain-containing protein n=1 Tax=Algicella marina TaxID=2683284 RepID=A0A6P1STY7_9RHOB|nr:DUF4129 domain-containing protein [Algicella marina]QHQ33888.1 DUF4129 domain-containing protein [Algicella marina]
MQILETKGNSGTVRRMFEMAFANSFTRVRTGLHFAAIGLALAVPAAAQENTATTITVIDPPRNQAYTGSLRFTRIDGRLSYVDEANGAIPMDAARITPPEPRKEVDASQIVRIWNGLETGSRIILLAILALLLYVAVKHGRIAARFQRAEVIGDANEVRQAEEAAVPLPEAQSFLQSIRAMKDREEALVKLIAYTLEAAGRQNSIPLRRSETAREFLNRLPSAWPSLPDLRRITMAEELVQFGGRPLAEKTFEDCLRRAENILRGTA